MGILSGDRSQATRTVDRLSRMITGAHILLYSTQAEADRAFFRDVLGFPYVDAGEGWLIFGLPAAEAGIHPAEGSTGPDPGGHRLLGAALYLMCDNLPLLMNSLRAKGVRFGEMEEAAWGIKTTMELPSGGEIGLYQPTHPTALELKKTK